MDEISFAAKGFVVFEDIKQDTTLTFWASRVLFRKHDIHEAVRTPHKQHRFRLRAFRVLGGIIILVKL
ncbi:hypothetical protein Leryth_006743 [Lithospermum erythrorhizon]|nr:hypothetical protein Leryth_006743 [Lithospermum erythrorhizon]